MAALSIRNVHKAFGPVRVLKGINLEVESGEFLILVGPSGCGKSTLLNMIAGLDTVTAGEIWIGGKLVNKLSPKDRDIAMVFQSYALYPTMNVRQNISFGLEMRKVPKEEQRRIVEKVAKILQIEHLLERKPSQLSGGQRQRVAMGRAIARDPQLFLFDEPLSNLDAKLRVEMRMEIKLLHEKLRATIVYVTHDQIEAMTLGSKIAVMKEGEIRQIGTPQEVYDDPADQFVAGFIGSPSMNFLPTRVIERDGGLGLEMRGSAGDFVLPVHRQAGKLRAWVGKEVVLGIRPEQITDVQQSRADGEVHRQRLKLELTEPTGPDTLAFVRLNEVNVCCRVRPDQCAPAGQVMELLFDLSKAVFFEPGSEKRIA
ncbi:MAG TPA: sn-glycerol-3-phosphate ABC transporter ATP-binding protein UgpC [Burkholderiales bacterium]|jgi:multiple sugar transport system ATP-binding protein|nr:sn-glycerol-3-phosphate ABC transporter ATP-binding protein UgpC [Burkholderiales bacterium]